jgi:hypothetical protein
VVPSDLKKLADWEERDLNKRGEWCIGAVVRWCGGGDFNHPDAFTGLRLANQQAADTDSPNHHAPAVRQILQ